MELNSHRQNIPLCRFLLCHMFFVNPPEMGHLLLFEAESVSPFTLLPRLSSTLLKEEKTDVGTLSKFSTNTVKKTDSLRI